MCVIQKTRKSGKSAVTVVIRSYFRFVQTQEAMICISLVMADGRLKQKPLIVRRSLARMVTSCLDSLKTTCGVLNFKQEISSKQILVGRKIST